MMGGVAVRDVLELIANDKRLVLSMPDLDTRTKGKCKIEIRGI
jgi:hypothetical protein